MGAYDDAMVKSLSTGHAPWWTIKVEQGGADITVVKQEEILIAIRNDGIRLNETEDYLLSLRACA